MEILNLNLKSKLLWQVGSFDHKVSLFQIIDLSSSLVIDWELVIQTSNILVEVTLLACALLGLLLIELLRDLAYLRSHATILVHHIECTFHQLSTFQQVVNMVSKDGLPVNVTLDFEQELPSSHPISDLYATNI